MIQVNKLVKLYGRNLALDEVSFTVKRGEIMGFLGPNGAGKSTMMNIITGFLSFNSGTVTIDDHDILEDSAAARRLIGFLPEVPPLYVDMKVSEYLNFVYELKGVTLKRDAHLDEICRVTKIADVKYKLISTLSKGFRQRLGIAQALIGNPPILIFDEPTAGLDPLQIIEVRGLIRKLGRDHTIILSTHILSEVQAICDRIVIINEGKILADEECDRITSTISGGQRYLAKICGEREAVLEAVRSLDGVKSAVFTGHREADALTYQIDSDDGHDIRRALFALLAEKNYPLIGLEAQSRSLEDVFQTILSKSGK